MPKHHLVSDVLHDLVIDDEGFGYAFVLPIIDEAWVDGKIKLLRISPGIAEPEVWEPAQRRIIFNLISGERLFKCSIEYRNDRGTAVTEFGDPFISDEDVQYVKRRAVAAGLVLAEPLSDVGPDSPYGLAASQYLSNIHISFQEFAKLGAEKPSWAADESRNPRFSYCFRAFRWFYLDSSGESGVGSLTEEPGNTVFNANQQMRKPIPNLVLLNYLNGIKEKGGPAPAADLLVVEIQNKHPDYHVTRADVRIVHKEVFGALAPGRRKKNG